MYLLCVEPVNIRSSVTANESANVLSATEVTAAGSVIDHVTTDVSYSIQRPVACASSTLGIELVSHADTHCFGDASHDSSVCSRQCGEEGGTVHGRIAREPIDRARYVVVNGNNGTMFACSLCSKQYIHRKSLNKHWNDKHAGDTFDRNRYLSLRSVCSVTEPLVMVHCPSDGEQHVPLSVNSSPTYSVAPVASSVHQTYSEQRGSQTKCTGTVRDSLLWQSLANIHSNQEPHCNSFYCTPMPAHIGGHYNAAGSFFSPLFADDDCHVLDLSIGSSDVHELLNNTVCDTPVDLCLKSNCMSLAGSENVALPSPTYSFPPVASSVHQTHSDQCGSQTKHTGTIRDSLLWQSLATIDSKQEHSSVETVSNSSVSYRNKISASDKLILNKSKRFDNSLMKFGDSIKNRKAVKSDSVALLRHLNSGILTNAVNQSVVADSSNHNSEFVHELESDCAEVKPAVRYKCHPNSVHFKNSLKMTVKSPKDDLATPEETHEYFGGISRGGYIRCKMCDFSATSMLLFSQHVARHVKKAKILSETCGDAQDQCGDAMDKLDCGFFTWLGLRHTGAADADSNNQSSDRCREAEVERMDVDENSPSNCKIVVCDISKCTTSEEQMNGFGSHLDDESRLHKNCSSSLVHRKPGRYQRGLGLTTTESRDAVGRSWRRRRLRTCERCGYVTDNLTTLKRHEVKHGALGMYRCTLCDYTVNQQHILEYHTQNAHRLSMPVGSTNSAVFKESDMPLLSDAILDEHHGNATSALVEGSREGCLSKGLSKKSERIGGDATQVHYGALNGGSQVAGVNTVEHAVSKCSMQKTAKSVQYPASVTLARRHLLDAFGLQLGRGICVRCGFRSLSIVRMKRHMLQHPHDRHACLQCHHTSLTASLLMKHRRQHADGRTGSVAQKKSYQCPECPFVAASPNRLHCHTQFHGVKLRHVCGECSYSVNRANLIAQHRRLHVSVLTTMQKRCWMRCNNCPYKTVNRGSLINHKRGHYAINCQYMCNLCSFGTDVANVAIGHQRLHLSRN